VPLPRIGRVDALTDVLTKRRTWREFGSEPLSKDALSTLLGLTWGYTGYLDVAPGVSLPLRTSPSGGGCQSIEVYVVARRVAGLKPGIYRYRSGSHGLDRVRDMPGDDEISAWIGGQTWVAGAAVICLMTSVFERVQWKYKFARAYRVVLLEAGHLCQTFCLVATALNLAPFCSAALADSAIERALGIDGIAESVLYAAGVGTKPQAAERIR
jgi:SagB-type dehydrogenase family enzyme